MDYFHEVLDEDEDPRDAAITIAVKESAPNAVVSPLRDAEIHDTTGELLVIAEAYCPEGLRPGQGEPTILALDCETTDIERLQVMSRPNPKHDPPRQRHLVVFPPVFFGSIPLAI